MKKRVRRFATMMLAGCFVASSVTAQQIVYPAKGQSAQQQKKDEADGGEEQGVGGFGGGRLEVGGDPARPGDEAMSRGR